MIKLFNLRVLIQFPLLLPFGAPSGLCCGLSPQIFSEFSVLRRIPLAQLNDHTKIFIPISLRRYTVLIRVSPGYPLLLGRFLRVTHPSAALLISEDTFSLDLHVLSLPPAFNLSHDQTLQLISCLLIFK